MSYLVAVLSDKTQAEAAYSALEQEGLPSDRINILGNGYPSADDYGLVDPIQSVREAATQKLYSLVPIGFFVGVGLAWVTGIALLERLTPMGNYLIAGFIGAVAGGIAAYLKSTNAGSIDSNETLPYRNRLDAGKYLIVIKGTEAEITDRATNVLNQFQPENIQDYPEPTGA